MAGLDEAWVLDLDPGFLEHIRNSVVPKMQSTSIAVTATTDMSDADLQSAIELGLLLLMDKPLLLLVLPDQQIGEHLRRAADEIIVVDDPDASERIQAFAKEHSS